MDVFGEKLLDSGKSGFIRAKVVVFRQKRLYLDKVVVIGQKLLYMGQSNSTRANVVILGQGGCIRAKWFY